MKIGSLVPRKDVHRFEKRNFEKNTLKGLCAKEIEMKIFSPVKVARELFFE